jgi:hypothetical protein
VEADRLIGGRAGKLSPVNVVETLLILVGIPLAVVVVLALLTLPGGRKRSRYKPGQPWEHAPVWYEPHPEHGPAADHGETKAIGSSVYGEPTGDAHGSFVAHGAPAATGHRPVDAGPLGGARGTW